MKKRALTVLCILLAVAVIAISGVTLAKYVVELGNTNGNIATGYFYFRSNVLTAEPSETRTVNGHTATFLLANGTLPNSTATEAGEPKNYSDMDIPYTVTYSVQIDGTWTVIDALTEHGTLLRNQYSTASVTVNPIEHEGTLYTDVLVTATSTNEPYITTLQRQFEFKLTPYTVSYDYSYDMGMITMTLTTNSDSGTFKLWWTGGLLPDNADPNGILTDAPEGDLSYDSTKPFDTLGSSLEFEIESYAFLRLRFFIDPDMRSDFESVIADMTEDELMAAIATAVTCELVSN